MNKAKKIILIVLTSVIPLYPILLEKLLESCIGVKFTPQEAYLKMLIPLIPAGLILALVLLAESIMKSKVCFVILACWSVVFAVNFILAFFGAGFFALTDMVSIFAVIYIGMTIAMLAKKRAKK